MLSMVMQKIKGFWPWYKGLYQGGHAENQGLLALV